MAVGVKSWSTTAANNATASSAVNWAEGQLAPTLNNSARALMAEVAAWRMQFGGISYGGSGNAYTATNNAVGTWSAYAAGDFIGLLANHTNTGAATINVDGLGAKNIVTNDGGALIAGDLTSGALVLLLYDGTSFQLVGSFASGSYQPLDATLTALAGVTVAANKLVYATGADAFATTDFTSFARTLVDDADAATARATLGLTIGTHVQAYDADLTTWAGVTPGTGVATALAVNVGSAGAVVVNGGALGTPSSGTLTSATGLPISTGVSGLGTGIATALAINTGSAGAPVLVNGALGTPSSGTLTNATGLPVGGISGLGTGVATFLATPSSANLAAAVTDETGSGALLFAGGALGTPASATLTNATGLPVSGITSSTSTALGVGSIELGHASDTTLSRVSAGVVAIEGVEVTTNTASQTLTNKTLSSPTLSGTVSAAGGATFSQGTYTYLGASDPAATNGQTGFSIGVKDSGGTLRLTYLYGVGTAANLQLPASGTFYISAASGSAGLQLNGVAIPTISSTDTLTNKTLSSPTLSGTVAGGPAFTVTSAGAATTPLILRNASSNASTEVILRFDPSVGGNRYAEISSSNDGSNNTGLTFRGGAGGSLTTGLTIGAFGAVNAPVSLAIGAVAVPTISSTDTLTNKTLSSPTLSGMVAGAPAVSGNWTWGGTTTVQFGDITQSKGTTNGWQIDARAATTIFSSLNTAYNAYTPLRIAASSLAYSPSGGADQNIATDSNTLTLTNKTLSSPTLSGTTTCGAINVSAASVAATINSTNNAYVLGISYASTTGGYIGTISAGNLRLTDSTITTILDVNTAKVVTTGTLQANKTTSAASPDTTSTSLTNVILRVAGSNVGAAGYGIDMGVSNSDGTSWIQSRDHNNYATNTTLRLNPNGGGATLGGVAIPTISSTDTLTNKTLSSPTLSGTVAGSVSFSGVLTLQSTFPALGWYDTDSTSGSRRSVLTHNSDNWLLFRADDSGAYVSDILKVSMSGALQAGGVAVPTISSTDTLSNKTLSSPTLSGTVAGTPTFSGSPFKIGDGTDTVAMTGTSPQLKVQGASFSTGITVRRDGNAEVGLQSSSRGNIGTWTNHAVNLYVNAANRIEFDTSLMTFNDAYNIAVGTTTGTKIGTATSQKIGFFDKTPVVQPTAVADATDAASVITQLNALLTRMRNLGLIAT